MLIGPKPKSRLQIEMDKLLLTLGDHEPTSEEFGQIVDRLSKLSKIEQDRKPSRINPDTLAVVIANLLGIAMIVRHEELNVITTKALGFVMKPR